MLSLLLATAMARTVVHAASASPPEAHYVLTDRTTCPVHVLVDPDGRVAEATVEGCADVLADAVGEAALRWRFAKGPDTTLEAIDVPVRPPSFTPRAKGRDCLLAFVIDDEGLRRLTAEPPKHCTVSAERAPPTPATRGRRTTAWCRIHVDVEQRSTTVDGCTEGFAVPTRALAQSLIFDDRATGWTLLVGYRP